MAIPVEGKLNRITFDHEAAKNAQGIYYFLSHPFLWPLLRARLLPSVLLSLFILTNLFIW